MRVRVVVHNVRGFGDGFERLVRLVGYFEPDLLLLNETGGRWRLRRFANARAKTGAATLELWQRRLATATMQVLQYGHRPLPQALSSAFLCIHRYEGAWNANTGNGYYGGLQMDRRFQSLYGSDYVARWGTADNWPAWAQLQAAVRAYQSGRGFYPWPNTARACGLI